jgi:hypothetical protein
LRGINKKCMKKTLRRFPGAAFRRSLHAGRNEWPAMADQ